ncbi:MAG TPA: dienelactone hydrolase family protein [Planctomycetota bacterium]|nr:dienelactone hydrolase family protein [Planctomycetota bacterium]
MLALVAVLLLAAGPDDPLPGTQPLREERDLADLMMDGLHQWADRKLVESTAARARYWTLDPSSRDAYEKSVAANRARFLRIIGAVDPRVAPRLERFGDDAAPALVAETPRYRIWQVRWPVLDGVTGEGLFIEPREVPTAWVVALPDADETPEQAVGLRGWGYSFARRLADAGAAVLVPVLLSRDFEFSGHPQVAMTSQSHREWIYRQAFHLGRHVIGYEVQKVLAAVDYFKSVGAARIGVVGVGEGGLIAFYAAAADPRIAAALVTGYFAPREETWKEPLYRNVWALLREFGDAELATLVAPRALLIEADRYPEVAAPGKPPEGRRPGAAAGRLTAPSWTAVKAEFDRIDTLLPAGFQPRHLLRDLGIASLMKVLGMEEEKGVVEPVVFRKGFDPKERQRRQVAELETHVQNLIRDGDRLRSEFFLGTTTVVKSLAPRMERFRTFRVKEGDPDLFAREAEKFRTLFWEEGMGKIEDPLPDPNPRSRKIYDREKWTGYDVVLDAAPEFFAWGVLLVPKDLKPGERRPVVVCQHGRNGLPKDTIEGDSWAYHDFAAKLADRGFIVFSPHNPYRGEDKYRLLSRKANVLKGSLFSFILHQHRQILAWLRAQSFVDPERIAFYGLSYGGETAIRVPPILKEYCLSICSGDFNDWTRKVAGTDSDIGFMYSIEWEMPYFNLGNTFNYSEMAALMVPRPFMVERGHHDGVARDEWVDSEYAKVRWLYAQLGLGDRTEIEHYNGGHTINGDKTFDFLRRHLNWPDQTRK